MTYLSLAFMVTWALECVLPRTLGIHTSYPASAKMYAKELDGGPKAKTAELPMRQWPRKTGTEAAVELLLLPCCLGGMRCKVRM